MSNKDKISLLYIFIAISFFNGIFGWVAVFHLCSLFFIVWSLRYRIKFKMWEKVLLLILPLFIIQAIVKKDMTSFLHSTSYILVIVAYSRIARTIKYDSNKYPINFLIFLVLPTIILYSFLHFKVNRGDSPLNLSLINHLIPSAVNNFRVNIGTPNFTKHFSGDMGLLNAIAGFFIYTYTKKKKYLVVSFFSIYVLFFSGARAALITFLCCIILFLINRRKVNTKLSFSMMILFVALFYLSNTIVEYLVLLVPVDSFLGELLKLQLYDTHYGITSSRDFLWAYHLKLFSSDVLLGVDSSFVRFSIGDRLADGTIASAGSESYYTAMLAQYGLLGLVFPILHLYFFKRALTTQNMFSIIWCAIFILENVFNSTFANVYGVYFFVYIMMFSSYEHNVIQNKPKKKRFLKRSSS